MNWHPTRAWWQVLAKQSLQTQKAPLWTQIVSENMEREIHQVNDKINYHESQKDQKLFTKHNSSGKLRALIVFVDDIIVTRNDEAEIWKLKTNLVDEFDIKDLRNWKYFLGIQVACPQKETFIPNKTISLIC